MKQFETEHYVFRYGEGTLAERDIDKIAACQEACYAHICRVLKTEPTFKIIYYLCNSPEEVGHFYGDDEPCNGFTSLPDTIYAVYNHKVKCIGFHEDAHVISYIINRPESPAIREGLAMYFDRQWWGIQNMDWTCYYIESGRFVNMDALLDRETFFSVDCSLTYPIVGAFVDYLIAAYGIDLFIRSYRYNDMAEAFENVYGKTAVQLNDDFVAYVKLFRLESAVKNRIEELLENG